MTPLRRAVYTFCAPGKRRRPGCGRSGTASPHTKTEYHAIPSRLHGTLFSAVSGKYLRPLRSPFRRRRVQKV